MRYFVTLVSIICLLSFVAPSSAQSLKEIMSDAENKFKAEEQAEKLRFEAADRKRAEFSQAIVNSAYGIKCIFFSSSKSKTLTGREKEQFEMFERASGNQFLLVFMDGMVYLKEGLDRFDRMTGRAQPDLTIKTVDYWGQGFFYKVNNNSSVEWNTKQPDFKWGGKKFEYFPSTLRLYFEGSMNQGAVVEHKCELLQNPKSMFMGLN
jgi:hypothetical protein